MTPKHLLPRFVSYLRVSTLKQGAFGLGIEAQRDQSSKKRRGSKGKKRIAFPAGPALDHLHGVFPREFSQRCLVPPANSLGKEKQSGVSGIRTHETFDSLHDFQSCSFDQLGHHSPNS